MGRNRPTKRRKTTMRKVGIVAVLSLMALAIAAVPALAASPHEVTNDPIQCVLNDNGTVTCSGSVAGLGNRAVVAQVDVEFACATRGNAKQPGGHLQSKSGPIQTRNGRITFSVTAGPASCPPGLNPVVGRTATVSILTLNGNVLYTTTVTIRR
jgi:hypothetical protein